jgi:hypothetical protein
VVDQPEELERLGDAEETTKAEDDGVLKQRRKRMGVIKSCSEMTVIREIEKAVLIGLKKEGYQRAAKDCELCPLAVWVENESRYLCKPADLLGTVKGWQRDEKKREEKKK